MASVAERSSYLENYTGKVLPGTPRTNHIDIQQVAKQGRPPRLTCAHYPRQAWFTICAHDTYQHSNLLRFLRSSRYGVGSLNGSWGASASGRSGTGEASVRVLLGPRVPGYDGRVARREPRARCTEPPASWLRPSARRWEREGAYGREAGDTRLGLLARAGREPTRDGPPAHSRHLTRTERWPWTWKLAWLACASRSLSLRASRATC